MKAKYTYINLLRSFCLAPQGRNTAYPLISLIGFFFSYNYVCMKSGEAEAASVLDESENKAEKLMLFKS